ncbi:MAG: dephospho-CoA kinase [Bacillota bacterium]
MIIIGLTGGIASGKSTVALMLQSKGALILDADQIARETVLPGREAWREIVDWLGDRILLEDGSLDRAALGRLIFNDAARRQKLNAIVHPRVGEEMLARTAAIRRTSPHAVLVQDIPLLIEAGLEKTVDLVLLVYVNPFIQLERLQQRDNLSREEALSRIHAQMPLEQKKQYAHFIIDNSGTTRDTGNQVDLFWQCHRLPESAAEDAPRLERREKPC